MSYELPGVNGALANAVRIVNARFARLPIATQDSIEIGHDELDEELEAALLSDDADRALAAVAAWRAHWVRVIEAAGASPDRTSHDTDTSERNPR